MTHGTKDLYCRCGLLTKKISASLPKSMQDLTHFLDCTSHTVSYKCKQPGCAAAGIAPYMALELGVFDLMPKDLSPFVRGFSSAFMATTLCYPLDTVRYASRVM